MEHFLIIDVCPEISEMNKIYQSTLIHLIMESAKSVSYA